MPPTGASGHLLDARPDGCFDTRHEQGVRHELRAAQRRFELVFEMAPVAFCILDGERVIATNRAFETLFDRPAGSSSRETSIYALLGSEARPQLEPLLAQAAAECAGDPIVHECALTLSAGRRVLEVGVAALPDAGRCTLQMVVSDVTKRNLERAELEHSRHELRQLSASVVRAREGARLHIARELHDELGQRLSALKLDLASLEPADDAGAFAERVGAMLGMLDETMTAVRRIAADLRPLMLDDLGLNAALEWLARESARRMGIEVTVHLGRQDPALDDDATIAAYRIVQEALTNAARHARATDVHIELREAAGELLLTVQDNGVGFAPDAARKTGSFGLLGIRERAQLLGGSMHTENPLGGGARLTVRLPLRADRDRAAPPNETSP
ncbi:MAG: ATP-binding protein [Burkholderiaceae bacterium]